MPESDPVRDCAALRAYLAHRDTPCPACGYNLRGVKDPVCPECGRALRMPIRAETRNAAWWIGRVGLACTYIALCVLAVTILRGNLIVGSVAALSLCSAPGRWRRWSRTRRAFGRLPRHIKQQLVAGWWAAAVFAGIVALSSIRGLGGPTP